jgi:hypothetical protein
MDVDDDAIGLVRDHRWLSVKAQTKQLREAGCSKIFDLDAQDRRDMEKIAGRRVVRMVYAFLLANPDRTRGMWADFLGSLARIEARGGVVADMSTKLDSSTQRAAFLDVVRGQVRRHNQGENPAERKGKPGRQKLTFSTGQIKQARAIWKDLVNFPTGADVKKALKAIKSKEGVAWSETRAYRLFKKRLK